MIKPSKVQAIDRIQKALDAIPEVAETNSRSQEFAKWRRNTEVVLEYTFGMNTRQVNEFCEIRYILGVISTDTPDYLFHQAWRNGLQQAAAILRVMLEEIHEYWSDDMHVSGMPEKFAPEKPVITNNVFVVHGKDEEAKQQVARFLESLGLKPIILQEQPSRGNTIIEKFEEHAQSAGFAVALCTPDDVGALASDRGNLKLRMRQNVVFELGYFAGKIGRKRVCALLKGNIERPSDYDGVVYIPLDDNDGWKLTLARELKAAGFDIDLNRIL